MGAIIDGIREFFRRIFYRHRAALRVIVFDAIDEAYIGIEAVAFTQADRALARAGITDPAIIAIVHNGIHQGLEAAKARVKAELDKRYFGGAA